jgi:hypothetical protein
MNEQFYDYSAADWRWGDFIKMKNGMQQWVGGGLRVVADHMGVGGLWGQLICVVPR